MKYKIVRMFLVTLLLIMGSTGVMIYQMNAALKNEDDGISFVLLDQIEQMTKGMGKNSPTTQIDELRERISSNSNSVIRQKLNVFLCVEGLLTGLCMLLIFTYIYGKMIRPFETLERYASDIADGNLEKELHYERENFFGAFTWAFDHMRKEIVRARLAEKEAVNENKTVIATLSHDIKTPLASIHAYAEGLEAGLDKDYETRERYLRVIIKKCDEVTVLINDLVLHSLSELDKLSIDEKPVNIGEMLMNSLTDLEYPCLKVHEPICDGLVLLDTKRFAQIIENILNNAKKYASHSTVDVWTECKNKEYTIHFMDHGMGIPPEDMPFIFQKFYRGKNAKNEQGSGLGLYIVKYLCQQMNGKIEVINGNEGLEVVLTFPIIHLETTIKKESLKTS